MKEPGRDTPGDGIFGLCGVPITALGRSTGDRPDDPLDAENAVTASDHRGDACGRVGKMVLRHAR